MIKRLFSRLSQNVPDSTDTGRTYQTAHSGQELIEGSGWRISQVRQIKRLYSVTAEIWAAHYLPAIESFASFAQELPASELHHHSRPGGLIDHTLEVLLAGSRVAQGYMLPPNAEPEPFASNGDRWRVGVVIALWSHDRAKTIPLGPFVEEGIGQGPPGASARR